MLPLALARCLYTYIGYIGLTGGWAALKFLLLLCECCEESLQQLFVVFEFSDTRL